MWTGCIVALNLLNMVAAALGLRAAILAGMENIGLLVIIGAGSYIGLSLFCAALQGRLVRALSTIWHYWLTAPVQTILIPIFSICNTHDVSWGTRPAADVLLSPEALARKRARKSALRVYRNRW